MLCACCALTWRLEGFVGWMTIPDPPSVSLVCVCVYPRVLRKIKRIRPVSLLVEYGYVDIKDDTSPSVCTVSLLAFVVLSTQLARETPLKRADPGKRRDKSGKYRKKERGLCTRSPSYSCA